MRHFELSRDKYAEKAKKLILKICNTTLCPVGLMIAIAYVDVRKRAFEQVDQCIQQVVAMQPLNE